MCYFCCCRPRGGRGDGEAVDSSEAVEPVGEGEGSCLGEGDGVSSRGSAVECPTGSVRGGRALQGEWGEVTYET